MPAARPVSKRVAKSLAEPPTLLWPRTFIDTNILVYVDALDEPVKQATALSCLTELLLQGKGVLSTQVLSEYANVALKKLGLAHQRVRDNLAFYARFEMLTISAEIIKSAVDLHQTRSLSFFDAQIVASAKAAACSQILTEDLNQGHRIDGLKILNPFN
jgi:predicted nucleic acid-binding protein